MWRIKQIHTHVIPLGIVRLLLLPWHPKACGLCVPMAWVSFQWLNGRMRDEWTSGCLCVTRLTARGGLGKKFTRSTLSTTPLCRLTKEMHFPHKDPRPSKSDPGAVRNLEEGTVRINKSSSSSHHMIKSQEFAIRPYLLPILVSFCFLQVFFCQK